MCAQRACIVVERNLSVALLKIRAITAAEKYFGNQTMTAVLNSLNALVV